MNIVLEPAILVQILDRILVQTLDQTEIVVLVHVLQDISGMDKDAQQFLTIAILDMFGVQTLAFILDHQTIVEIIKFGMEDNVLSQLLAQLTNIIMEPVVYQSLILVLLDTLGAIQVVLLSLLLLESMVGRVFLCAWTVGPASAGTAGCRFGGRMAAAIRTAWQAPPSPTARACSRSPTPSTR